MKKKVVIITLVCILLIALSVWVAGRWPVWFGKNPEPAFCIGGSISCVQLSIGDDPLTQRYVSWRSRPDSALLTSDQVQLIWTSDNDTVRPLVHKKLIATSGGSAIYFWALVDSLKPGGYRYAISAPDTITPYYSTSVTPDSVLRVMFIGDVQDKRYTGTDTLIRKAVDSVHPDVLIQLGDLIERPHQAYWDRYFQDFDSVRTTIPMAVVVGNHDYHKGLNKYPDERLFYTFPYYLKEDSIAPLIGCKSFDLGPTQLYMIDTNQPLWRLLKERRWLKNCLSNSTGAQKRVVLMHHALRSAKSVFNNLIVRWTFEPVVREGNVSLVLAAHEHTFQHLSADQTGGYEQYISHFSAKNYEDADGESGRRFLLFSFPVR